MAARTIDPATGASTWALGSQRWTVNMGSFTKKAVNTKAVNNPHDQKNLLSSGRVRRIVLIMMFEELTSVIVHTIIRSKGSEAATV